MPDQPSPELLAEIERECDIDALCGLAAVIARYVQRKVEEERLSIAKKLAADAITIATEDFDSVKLPGLNPGDATRIYRANTPEFELIQTAQVACLYEAVRRIDASLEAAAAIRERGKGK